MIYSRLHGCLSLYQDGKLYSHCAKEGHNTDAIRGNDEVIPAKRTTAYISVIAFGKAVIVDDELGLRRIAGLIGEKFPPTTRRTAGSRRTR